ncbi:sensor histidine kinase [Tunturiibacter psychrotolerans]|uniref:sensor histidine kinase n=1 Tax=Tunturiibacter psychrotolerans TaxID=3069686 RepID=UPI003D1B6EF9
MTEGRAKGEESELIIFLKALRPPWSCRFAYVLILFVGVHGLNAQDALKLIQLNHMSWTARDGAPSEIAGLGQTADGILWIGSGSGLYRFDGTTFSLFQPAQGEPPLPRISIRSLCVAQDGAVWVGFRPAGVAAIRNGHVKLYGVQDGLPPDTTYQLLQANDGTMWAIAGLHLWQLRGERWQRESPSEPFSSERVYKMFFDKAGTQWVGTNKWIYRRESDQDKFEATKEVGGELIQFAESPDGSLWVGGEEGAGAPIPTVRRLNVEGHRSPDPMRLHVLSDTLLFDPEGQLWIASVYGLLKVSPREIAKTPIPNAVDQDKQFKWFGHDQGLSTDSATAIFKDASGDIWVGTMRGLDRFEPPKLIHPENVPVSDRRMMVTSCSDGEVWIAVPLAPLVSIRDGRTTTRIDKTYEINSIYCGPSNVIWFTDDHGIGRFDRKSTTHIPLPEGMRPSSAKQVIEASDGSIFVTFRNASDLWRWQGGIWSSVTVPSIQKEGRNVIFQDRSGRLWAGYGNGTIAVLEDNSGHDFQCPTLGDVTAFAVTSHGFLVGGMNGIAVQRGNRFDHLPLEDELHVRGISGLVEADNGDLWLNVAYGVARIPQAEFLKALDSSAYRMKSQLITEGSVIGPAPLSYALPSAVRGARGTIWFANSSTAFYVDPKRLPQNLIAPVLTISSVSADGAALPDYRRIRPGVNTLVIKYAGINLPAPERVTYRYRLEGSDTTWQEVGSRTEAVYTKLRPGHYVFDVLASNGEGVWSQPSSTRFQVLPAFYQTAWFALMCFALAVAAVWLVLMLRIQRVTETARIRAEERADERVRIARDLHDTLLQGVQGLMLRFDVASQEVPEGGRARSMLEDALKSADTILLEGRNRVRSLRSDRLKDLTLAEALDGVGRHFTPYSKVRFDVLTEGPVLVVDPIVLEEVFCIEREAITNAFQHADPSYIEVAISYGKKEFVVSCADDGLGIDPMLFNAGGRPGHWGLVGMKERAERIGAKFECLSSPANGTRIIITLPANRAYGVRSPIMRVLFKCLPLLRS